MFPATQSLRENTKGFAPKFLASGAEARAFPSDRPLAPVSATASSSQMIAATGFAVTVVALVAAIVSLPAIPLFTFMTP